MMEQYVNWERTREIYNCLFVNIELVVKVLLMIPTNLYAFAVMKRKWSFQVRSLDMMTPRSL